MIRRRGAIYHLRRRVPAAAREAVGKAEVWLSLETSIRRLALARAGAMLRILDRAWIEIEAMSKAGHGQQSRIARLRSRMAAARAQIIDDELRALEMLNEEEEGPSFSLPKPQPLPPPPPAPRPVHERLDPARLRRRALAEMAREERGEPPIDSPEMADIDFREHEIAVEIVESSDAERTAEQTGLLAAKPTLTPAPLLSALVEPHLEAVSKQRRYEPTWGLDGRAAS